MEILILDQETRLPTITAQALVMECFYDLWRRVRKIDGDHDGRRKIHNLKELGYIYFQGKYDSRFKMMEDKEREEKIRSITGLPLDWKPDTLVEKCLEEYKNTQVTQSSELVSSLEGIAGALTSYLKNIKASISGGNITTVKPDTIKDVLDLIKQIPEVINDLARAKAALDREQNALATGKKGRTLNKFEIPD